jgi:hypothetical protein
LSGWNALWEVKWDGLMKWMWVMNDEYTWVVNEDVCEHETWFMWILKIDGLCEYGKYMNLVNGWIMACWLVIGYMMMIRWWIMVELINDTWMNYWLAKCKWWNV